jgi:hypothetical protein
MLTLPKKVFFSFILILLILGVSELGLHIFSWCSPKADVVLSKKKNQETLLIPDKTLGVRGNPSYPDHDPKGFRNRQIPQPGRVDVITLGDSQTYGYGVAWDESWPLQLAHLKHQTVYNMAIEDSGPVQSLLLFDEVLEFRPKAVLAAIYLGNDLFNSYDAVYLKKLAPTLGSTDKQTLKVLDELEKHNPLIDQIHKEGAIAYQDDREYEIPSKHFLAEHSKLWGLFQAAYRTLFQREDDWDAIQKEVLKTKEHRQAFDNGKVRAVFTPNYRLIAVDTGDLRIREGLRITLDAVLLMAEKAQTQQISFSVILIPTKENVFKNLVKSDSVSDAYKRQTAMEAQVHQKILNFLQSKKIPVIDALSEMRQQTRKGAALYPITWDGHPNKVGYRAIAEAIVK